MKNSIQSIHIELISKCNLKCVHCELNRNSYESKGNKINFEHTINLLKELKPKEKNSISLILQGVGEASLHPQFEEFLKIGIELGYRVSTTSNLLAWKKNKYKSFLDIGLNLLTVSVDTINQDLTEKTRKGTNVEKLKENLIYLSQYYSKKLYIYTVVSDITIDYIDELYEFIKQLNVQKWQFIYLLNEDGTQGISKENKIKLAKKVDKFKDINNLVLPIEQNESYCQQPFNILHINAMGYIMPCCLYWDHNLINFGNIENKNINLQFNSVKFNTFRKEMSSGKAEICTTCTLYKPYSKNMDSQ